MRDLVGYDAGIDQFFGPDFAVKSQYSVAAFVGLLRVAAALQQALDKPADFRVDLTGPLPVVGRTAVVVVLQMGRQVFLHRSVAVTPYPPTSPHLSH